MDRPIDKLPKDPIPVHGLDRSDCPNESDHIWELCSDGILTYKLCIWCGARVRAPGRKNELRK